MELNIAQEIFTLFFAIFFGTTVATTVEDGRKLAEDGWTYFQEFEGVKVIGKPI